VEAVGIGDVVHHHRHRAVADVAVGQSGQI
jgi:hypothetical protein